MNKTPIASQTVSTLIVCGLILNMAGCGLMRRNLSKIAEAHTAERQTTTPLLQMRNVLPLSPSDAAMCPLVEIQFINDDVGWAHCGGNLWRTQNGGGSWEHIQTGNPEVLNFYFSDAQTGWSNTLATLSKTKDGGRIWQPLTVPFSNPRDGVITSLAFLPDGKRGWIAGGLARYVPPAHRMNMNQRYHVDEKHEYEGTIFYTEDGGETWQQQDLASSSSDEDFLIGSLTDGIYISGNQQIWAFDNNSPIYLSGGVWHYVDYERGKCENQGLLVTSGLVENASSYYAPADIHFTDEKHGWMSFKNGYVAKSDDGGSTWCDLVPPGGLGGGEDAIFLTKIHFANMQKGIALDSNGNLLTTEDSGRHWKKIETTQICDDISFVTNSEGFAVTKSVLFRVKL